MSADAETLGVYAAKAGDYAERFVTDLPDRHLSAFMAELPAGGRVLDLGCGPGKAAARMRDAEFAVEAWDASPAMGDLARRLFGLEVRVAEFAALEAVAAFDGVYANFSLLHAPKSEMPDHLARIARALASRGVLHLGLKTGAGERRDALGRFYAFYTDAEITGLLSEAGFSVVSRATGAEAGLAGTVDPFLILKARKND